MQQISEKLCFKCKNRIANDLNENKVTMLLHYTVKFKHGKCLQALLKAGVDVNVADGSTFTALMKAAKKGYIIGVKSLIQAGADVNRRNKEDETALVLAASIGQDRCVELLLNAGADVNALTSRREKGQFTGLHAAVMSKNIKCVELLLTAGADVNKEGIVLSKIKKN